MSMAAANASSSASLTKSVSKTPRSGQTTKKSLPTPKRQIHPVIEIVNGSKHYGFCSHTQVLRRLNLSVYDSEIFALLGPHGCGKSTVLHMILGFKALDSGTVTIFGFKPGHELSGIPGIRVGYTPQSNGLYPEFTVKETLRYYGQLLHLKGQYVSQRISFLSDLLAIPQGDQYIKNCPEGTKRQLSFAIALLHEPELLILDEPCAGIDPVLRRGMWEHMKELVKQEKTILVTTQSCEEARLADKIGIMRNGNLLIDGNPRELVQLHKEKLLETLYRRAYSSTLNPRLSTASIEENPLIKLEPLNVTSSEGFIYTGDGEPHVSEIEVRFKTYPESLRPVKAKPGRELKYCCESCRRLGVLLIRDIARAFRSFIWLFLFLILPSLFLIIYCTTIGTTPTALVVAVVNYEASEKDCLLNYNNYLSCQLLDLIDEKIIYQKKYNTSKEAFDAAYDLKVSAVLVISRKFSRYVNKLLAEVVLGKDDSKTDTAPITLSLDVTSRIVANTIESTIKAAIESYIRLATKDTKVQEAGLRYPLTISEPIFGTDKTTDTEYMVLGLIVVLAYHMAAFVVAISLVTDRANKITERSYLAGVCFRETVLSQMVVYGGLTMAQAVLLFCVLIFIFDMPVNGNLWYIALLVLIQIWCGVSYGVFVAMLTKSRAVAGIYVFCDVATSIILCGIQWPLNGLPQWLYTLIQFLPQTQSIQAVRTIFQRGTSITHPRVWIGIVVPVCWFCLFTLCYSVLKQLT